MPVSITLVTMYPQASHEDFTVRGGFEAADYKISVGFTDLNNGIYIAEVTLLS